ncbi:nagb/rpia/CoA transferase-like protein [Xylariaceae sp. FL1651]|nr:nagb/rpia/CoA transferase-like protein [Xylariaceae sp. FL1651]
MATDDDATTATIAGANLRQLPIRSNPDLDSFDIVKTYHRLLADDPELTMPVAAIEALIEALGASSAKTVFETMDLVKTQSDRLRRSPTVTNPMAVRHGTDLFQQYLVRSLKQPPSGSGAGVGAGSTSGGNGNDDHEFEVVRQHLLRNGRLFAARAKEAREKIALVGRHLIADNYTILTHGGSRVVGTLLERAAEAVPGDAPRRFKVIYAVSDNRQTESNKVIAALRAKGVPVATIPEGGVAHIMSKVKTVLVGAEVVTQQGGIISRLGTYQIAKLAKADGKPFYVAAEQHKFGQTFPGDQFSFGNDFEQNLLDFYSNKAHKKQNNTTEDKPQTESAAPLDFTPPELITSFICDHGIKSTVAVEHEVIDMFVG